MFSQKITPLTSGYTAEFDTVSVSDWYHLLSGFDDANIYQTWAYAQVISGSRRMSHLVLRRNDQVVAIAQARIMKLPFFSLGIAYVHWGPLWQRSSTEPDLCDFRQAVRALRNEYVCKRGLTVRLFPCVFEHDSSLTSPILAEEGFSVRTAEPQRRTIVMDLEPPLTALREGLGAMFKRNLKTAERKSLEIVEGSEDVLFGQFVSIYKEMVSRKKFVEPNDIHQFQAIQAELPERFKMMVLLSKTGNDIGSGVICSAIGNTAMYLFGATSTAGLKTSGSYFLQWKLIEALKRRQIAHYNLNGINPSANPGTYKFKNDLAGKNGKDVQYLGRLDSYAGPVSHLCVNAGDVVRSAPRKLKNFLTTPSKQAVNGLMFPQANQRRDLIGLRSKEGCD